MIIRPYLIVPNLIIQPTWGGKYICEHKQITHSAVVNENIGQAYELYEDSNLSESDGAGTSKPFEVGLPENPTKVTKYDGNSFSINQLVAENQEAVLGNKALNAHGPKVQILIKFTQAKENSYQLHVKEETEKWFPKPESWYYLEDGLITLGIKPGADIDKYHKTCLKINDLAEKLSREVKSGQLEVMDARKQLSSLITLNNPADFVNRVSVKKSSAVDLSDCGLHHSWESDDKIAPFGNVVYEVQKNVYDPVSTIRSFDQGKVKDDGSIRPLQIDDYFKYIDRSAEANDPQSHLVETSEGKIFHSEHYSMEKLSFLDSVTQNTSGVYHHLFVKEGKVQLLSGTNKLIINQGYGAFVPAATGEYFLNSLNSKAVVFKTYL